MALSDVGGPVSLFKEKILLRNCPNRDILALIREFEKEKKMLSLLCTQDQTNVNKSFHKGGVKATKTYFDSLLLQRAKRRLTPSSKIPRTLFKQ